MDLKTALDKCLEYARPAITEIIKPEYGYQRILADNLYADIDVPGFPRSSVDGFTICGTDIDQHGFKSGLGLELIGRLAAGDLKKPGFSRGQTVEIMTGALLPAGTAAVVKKENVKEVNGRVYVEQLVKTGENIQDSGSQIAKGSLLASAGQLLDITALERMASCGIENLAVFIKPAVYVITTGSELIAAGNKLSPGQIYASNKVMYFNHVAARGCKPLGPEGPIPDEVAGITEQIYSGIRQSNLIIISGGSQQGKFDLVREAIRNSGAETIFTGLTIKPGQGTSAAVKNGVIILNLPGNPGAGSIMFEALGRPIICKLRGMTDFHNKWFSVPLSSSNQIREYPPMLVRGSLEIRNGHMTARLSNKREKPDGLLNLIMDTGSMNKNLIQAFITD